MPRSLLLALSGLATVAATHVELSWRPFTDSPELHGYKRWCTAKLQYVGQKPIGDYSCDGHQIAVWNADGLPNNTLEFNTPCGTGGYGIKREWFGYLHCHGPTWIVCWGDSKPGAPNMNCRGFHWHDDAYWPDQLQSDQIPASIEVWWWPRKIPA
ncbi:unnamed protein product [Jaminaea pallidilutea]